MSENNGLLVLLGTTLRKLRGRPAQLIRTRLELNSESLIKNAFITFTDQRGIDCFQI